MANAVLNHFYALLRSESLFVGSGMFPYGAKRLRIKLSSGNTLQEKNCHQLSDFKWQKPKYRGFGWSENDMSACVWVWERMKGTERLKTSLKQSFLIITRQNECKRAVRSSTALNDVPLHLESSSLLLSKLHLFMILLTLTDRDRERRVSSSEVWGGLECLTCYNAPVSTLALLYITVRAEPSRPEHRLILCCLNSCDAPACLQQH